MHRRTRGRLAWISVFALAAACATPAKPSKKTAKKRPAKAKSAEVAASTAPDLPPPPPPEPAETTAITPSLTYRVSSLMKRPDSPYFKDSFKNTADQLYATVRFERSYDYRHNIVIEPSFRTIRENPASMDAPVLEQAFIDSALLGKLYLTAGKKTEYEGSGFMVNPSDLLNEDKGLFDPLYQSQGKVFTRLRYVFDDATLALGFVPRTGQEAKRGRLWVQGATTAFDTDVRLQVMHQETEKSTFGLSFSRYFGEIVELHYDGRYQARQRLPSDPGQGHMAYSSYQYEDPSTYHAFGSRLVVTGRRTIIAEGIQQQSGLRPEEFEAYHAELREIKAENSSRVAGIPDQLHGRRYAFVSYQDDDTLPKTHIGVSYLTNLNDKSVFWTANILRHLSPITSIELSTMSFLGETDSEFGAMPFPRATHLILRGKF